MNSDKKNRGIIVFLLLALVAIGVLSFQNARDYANLQDAFLKEKNELKTELDKIITDYDDAITSKINISTKLRKERNRVVQLRDSISNLQEKNYFLMRKYRKRIVKLEEENRLLFAKVDSLNEANSNLIAENTNVKEKLIKKEQLNNHLKKSQKDLENKVAIAEVLKINDLNVIPLKKKSNGKYVPTSKSRKIEAFKVSFDILKNEVAKKGVRKIYIQLLDMDKNIISANGYTILKNGHKMVYSDVFSADFNNQEMSLVNLIEIEKGHVKKGKYIISAFIEGELMDRRIIELK